MAVLESAINAVKNLFTDHDKRVAEHQATKARLEAEGRERHALIEAAQRDVEAIEEPKKRLERLLAEEMGHGYAATNLLNAQRNWLTDPDNLTPAHAKFQALCDRLEPLTRALDAPPIEQATNWLTADKTITKASLDAIERWRCAVSGPPDPAYPDDPRRRLPSALQVARRACANELWQLPHAAQLARIAELRAAIEASFAGTALEHEIG